MNHDKEYFFDLVMNGPVWTNEPYVRWFCVSGYIHQAASSTLWIRNGCNKGAFTIEGVVFWRGVRNRYFKERPDLPTPFW